MLFRPLSICQTNDQCGDDEQAILDYFETNYIGKQRRGRRLRPLFPHEMWNVNTRVEEHLPRKGWHNRFSGSLGQKHANIWAFINGIKSDSVLHQHTMTEILTGAPPPLQRPVYRRVNLRLQHLVENYQNDDIITFLRGIAYNLA